MPAPKSDDWIHLFTSTIRPLYISDALDLLASPAGSIIRFRYEQSYVEPGLRKQWEIKNGLRGKRVLVHFAIQHPAEFHLPSYIPIREATVTGNFVEGHALHHEFLDRAHSPLSTDAPGGRHQQWQRYRRRR